MDIQNILTIFSPNLDRLGGGGGGGGVYLDKVHYWLINSTFPPDVQKKTFPENSGQVLFSFITFDKNDDLFLSQAEKDIYKIYLNYVNVLNLYQESYFLYDRSNVVKQSFVNKLNQFLPIYCSVSFFGEKKKDKMHLISPKNSESFFVERDNKKENIWRKARDC